MTNGIERWATIFKSVDLLIPPYLAMGDEISPLAAALEHAPLDQKPTVLELILEKLYDERFLSKMLLGLYSKIIFVSDFKVQISEAIEASFAGLHHAAVATMLPVLEGVVRKNATAAGRDVGSGTKKIIDELDRALEKENQSPYKFQERVVMLEALRDFFDEKLLKNTALYVGMDEFDRHGILHGIFGSYGVKLNFYRAVTTLNSLCIVITCLHGGFSMNPPVETSASLMLAGYYGSLKQQKPDSIRDILLFP
jgi:hypothetical protein